jgi:2-polyprenyl-3-methyl-5-hydroxy-6-metoxy-1,4-benzoquinol methylase
MTLNRILGTKIEIDSKSVSDFFENRVKAFNPEHPLTAVLYQDSNPSIAESRDAYEKKITLPLLELSGKENMLDIGCGIGRWAEVLKGDLHNYCGIDFCSGLVDLAKKSCIARNVKFLVAGAEDVASKQVSDEGPFNRFIISGLMIYLNERQIIKMLQGICSVAYKDAQIYIREPLAVSERLTLDKFWSEELFSNYSAIYRTQQELRDLIKLVFGEKRVKEFEFNPVYAEESLNNRKETRQYYTVIKFKK